MPVHIGRAGVRAEESQNQLEEDGLARAARAEQDAHAAARNGEADVAEDDVVVEGKGDPVEDDGEIRRGWDDVRRVFDRGGGSIGQLLHAGASAIPGPGCQQPGEACVRGVSSVRRMSAGEYSAVGAEF